MDLMDALPRTCRVPGTRRRRSARRRSARLRLRDDVRAVFGRVVDLLVFPHREDKRSSSAGDREPREVRLGARIQQALVVGVQRVVCHLRRELQCCALEDRLERRLTIPIEAACLPYVGTQPVPMGPADPIRRRPHHDGKPARGPELAARPEPVRGHHDRHDLGWSGWRNTLVFVQPSTVIAWQRRRFRDHWAHLSRPRSGRPAVARELRELIRKMSTANPGWGSPRIVGELAKLGVAVSKSTVEKYMVRPRKSPSPTWRAFLENHLKDLVATDFFVVPTVSFKVLFVFVVLAHARRRVVHFNVTEHPTAQWTAQQISEAFPWTTAPRFLIRDRDRLYGAAFKARVECMGIEQVLIAPQSPWQNPYAERVIGTIRRDCLDNVIVLGERHLRRLLADYFEHYHR